MPTAGSASERRLAFEPSPYRAELRDRNDQVAARILLAAPAAVAELEDGREGPFLQLLVRMENRGAAELTFDPARVEVLDDELAAFGSALADVDGPARVGPGETASFVLFLPYRTVPYNDSVVAPQTEQKSNHVGGGIRPALPSSTCGSTSNGWYSIQ